MILSVLAPGSQKRAGELADWLEANSDQRPFWASKAYQDRFADMSDAELRAAAEILNGRAGSRERQAALHDVITAGLKAIRLHASPQGVS